MDDVYRCVLGIGFRFNATRLSIFSNYLTQIQGESRCTRKRGIPPFFFSQFAFSLVSLGFLFLSVSLSFTTTRPHRNRSDGLLHLPVCTSGGPQVLEGTPP